MKKFRIQDRYENEYEWTYTESQEEPKFEFVIDHPFDWNRKSNHTKELVPLILSYLDPYLKCFSHHSELDDETSVDSNDF